MTAQGGNGRAAGYRTIGQCAYCRRDTAAGEGCTTDRITFPDGVVLDAIPYGEESVSHVTDRCPGCEATREGYHHPFCPVEECPRCGRRLMRCGCLDTDCVSRRWPE